MNPILKFPEALRPAELKHSDTLTWLYAEGWLDAAMEAWAVEPRVDEQGTDIAASVDLHGRSHVGVVGDAFLSPGPEAVDRAASMFCEALCRGSRRTRLPADDVRWARGMGVAVLGPLVRPLLLSDCCAMRLIRTHLLSAAEARLWRSIGTVLSGIDLACGGACTVAHEEEPAAARLRLARMVRAKAGLPALAESPVP